jgi:hypothetical protein
VSKRFANAHGPPRRAVWHGAAEGALSRAHPGVTLRSHVPGGFRDRRLGLDVDAIHLDRRRPMACKPCCVVERLHEDGLDFRIQRMPADTFCDDLVRAQPVPAARRHEVLSPHHCCGRKLGPHRAPPLGVQSSIAGQSPAGCKSSRRWFLACSEPGAAQVAGWDDHPSDRVGRGRDRARPLYCYPLESTDDAPEMSTLPTTPDPLAPAYVVVGPAGRKAPCTGPPNSKPRTVNTPDARPAPRKSMTVNA